MGYLGNQKTNETAGYSEQDIKDSVYRHSRVTEKAYNEMLRNYDLDWFRNCNTHPFISNLDIIN